MGPMLQRRRVGPSGSMHCTVYTSVKRLSTGFEDFSENACIMLGKAEPAQGTAKMPTVFFDIENCSDDPEEKRLPVGSDCFSEG